MTEPLEGQAEISALQREASKFRPQNSAVTPPPLTLVIKPEEWTYDFATRPVTEVLIGLRIPSSEDMDRADATAKAALADGGEEARERALKAFAAARCICDPDDVTRGHPMFTMAEDEVPRALNRRTIDRIVEEVALLMLRTVPLHAEADDDELVELLTILSMDDPFVGLTAERQRVARVFLKKALEQFTD